MPEGVLNTGTMYDIAMSIGTSLDLHQMLCVSLRAIIENLGCEQGAIYLFDRDMNQVSNLRYLCAFPDRVNISPTIQELADSTRQDLVGRADYVLRSLPPIASFPTDGNLFYRILLPTQGVLILEKKNTQLSPDVTFALTPILRKLDQAIINAIQYQNLQKNFADTQAQYKKSVKLVDEFLASMSHEFRTPLTLVMGFVETMLEGRPGPLTETQRRFLQNSYHASDQLLKLIDELLAVTHLRRGDIQLEKSPVHPDGFLQSLHENIQAQTKQKQIELIWHNEWDADKICLLDNRWMESAINQIVDNAIKFTPEGETIRVNSFCQNDSWRFQMSDAGSGISDKDLPHIFNRFYRGENAKSEQLRGVGLGLNVCQTVIEAHMGKIGINNNPDKGATLWFEIPAFPVR